MYVLKLESDYDFISMFVQQTLLIGQMRNLIMITEEREERERGGQLITLVLMSESCVEQCAPSIDAKTVFMRQKQGATDWENSVIGFLLMRCVVRTRY